MRVVLVVLAGLLAVACARTQPLVGTASISVVSGDQLPPPEKSDFTTPLEPFHLGPLDKIKIEVFGIEEMSQEIQTDASGRITFPLLGTIDALGRTPGELATLIEDGLRNRYVKNPKVSVNLVDTVSQTVTVDGEVKEPGVYPALGNMTLMRAVASAKGTSEFAKLEDVVIFRTVENKKMAALYNLKAIRRGNYDDPRVYPNDVIVVGDSQARRIFKDFLSVSPLLTAPLIAVLNNN